MGCHTRISSSVVLECMQWHHGNTYANLLLWLVHIADADKTKLSCLVSSCVHTANATKQDSFVASPIVFTADADKTKLSCFV